jgi:hypothetical protein
MEYKKLLKQGAIKEAYRGLMDYFHSLRVYFQKRYPDYSVSGSVYHGFMDMTYFSLFPKSVKRRQLKVAIVFIHDTCRFEVWLVGRNKTIQTKYNKLFTETNWKKYHITSIAKGVDSILDHILIDNPNFSDLDNLTKQIERGTLKFIEDVETFFLKHQN